MTFQADDFRTRHSEPFPVGHDRQLWLSTNLHKSSKRPFQKRGNLIARTVQR